MYSFGPIASDNTLYTHKMLPADSGSTLRFSSLTGGLATRNQKFPEGTFRIGLKPRSRLRPHFNLYVLRQGRVRQKSWTM